MVLEPFWLVNVNLAGGSNSLVNDMWPLPEKYLHNKHSFVSLLAAVIGQGFNGHEKWTPQFFFPSQVAPCGQSRNQEASTFITSVAFVFLDE